MGYSAMPSKLGVKISRVAKNRFEFTSSTWNSFDSKSALFFLMKYVKIKSF
jgi:hypothetical protein